MERSDWVTRLLGVSLGRCSFHTLDLCPDRKLGKISWSRMEEQEVRGS